MKTLKRSCTVRMSVPRSSTLERPQCIPGPQFVTWTSEMQKFHLLPPNVPAYPEIPRAAQSKNA
jgi:hypothetical protein